MPIRRELRKFYRGAAWQATRRRILARAGGRFDSSGKYRGGAQCECCGRPDRKRVWVIGPGLRPGPDQIWSEFRSILFQRWRSSAEQGKTVCGVMNGPDLWAHARRVLTQLGIAHRNHVAGDDRDENLAAWCRWCHLFHDREQHHVTRSTRKDARRPLLESAV